MLKFEDKIKEIDSILQSKKSFWNLEAVAHVNYEDVCQIIRLHIYTKWEKWDQTRSFVNWVTSVINRQIINLRVKFYGKFAPPCVGCHYNDGCQGCSFTSSGARDSTCPEYANWLKKKESGYRLLLAESCDAEFFDEEGTGRPRINIAANDSPDYEKAQDRLHQLMMKDLEDNEKMKNFYRWMFIENRDDLYIAERAGFKTTEMGKRPGYKQIANIKQKLAQKAKKMLEQVDIFSDA